MRRTIGEAFRPAFRWRSIHATTSSGFALAALPRCRPAGSSARARSGFLARSFCFPLSSSPVRGLAEGGWLTLVFSFTLLLSVELLLPSVGLVVPDVVPDMVPDDDGLALVPVFWLT